MSESLSELRLRVDELENQLARERQMQFELRRQLLTADEALDQVTAQFQELETCRVAVAQLVNEATALSIESGESDALWALVARISNQLNMGRAPRTSPAVNRLSRPLETER